MTLASVPERIKEWVKRFISASHFICKDTIDESGMGYYFIKYIFVNNTGRKVAEFNRIELARALHEKRLVQLEDGALFERALKKIVTNFQERQYQTDKEWQ